VLDKRRAPRFSSLAQARIAGLDTGEALLRDLSITGCRLEFSAAVAFPVGLPVRLLVVPETNAAVEPFDLEVETVWCHAGYDSYEVGFAIRTSPKGRSFKRYVDYLAWRTTGALAPVIDE
jgi:hypothetical protein